MANQLSGETAAYLKKFGEERLAEITQRLTENKTKDGSTEGNPLSGGYAFTDEEAKKMKEDIEVTCFLLAIAREDSGIGYQDDDQLSDGEDDDLLSDGEDDDQEGDEAPQDRVKAQEYVVKVIVNWLKNRPGATLQELQVFGHHIFNCGNTRDEASKVANTEYLKSQTTLELRTVVWDWTLVQNIDQELNLLYPELIGSGGCMGARSHGYPKDGAVLDHFPSTKARYIGVFTFMPDER